MGVSFELVGPFLSGTLHLEPLVRGLPFVLWILFGLAVHRAFWTLVLFASALTSPATKAPELRLSAYLHERRRRSPG